MQRSGSCGNNTLQPHCDPLVNMAGTLSVHGEADRILDTGANEHDCRVPTGPQEWEDHGDW